jgi:hypothetical protein
MPVTAENASQTELSIERQPGLLGLDWTSRLPARARTALRGAKALTFVGTGSSHYGALWASRRRPPTR